MNFGEGSNIIQRIQDKTKVKKDEIYDVLACLPEVMAEIIMQEGNETNKNIHFGFMNATWQNTHRHKPEVSFYPSKRFKTRFSELKIQQQTPLAKILFANVFPHLKEKMNKKRLKNK